MEPLAWTLLIGFPILIGAWFYFRAGRAGKSLPTRIVLGVISVAAFLIAFFTINEVIDRNTPDWFYRFINEHGDAAGVCLVLTAVGFVLLLAGGVLLRPRAQTERGPGKGGAGEGDAGRVSPPAISDDPSLRNTLAAKRKRVVLPIIGISLVVLVFGLSHFIKRAIDRGEAEQCLLNMNEVVLWALIWAEDHNNRLPADFAYLETVGDHSTPVRLVCPADRTNQLKNFTSWTGYQQGMATYEMVGPAVQKDSLNRSARISNIK